jgi:hypothetical protein
VMRAMVLRRRGRSPVTPLSERLIVPSVTSESASEGP